MFSEKENKTGKEKKIGVLERLMANMASVIRKNAIYNDMRLSSCVLFLFSCNLNKVKIYVSSI